MKWARLKLQFRADALGLALNQGSPHLRAQGHVVVVEEAATRGRGFAASLSLKLQLTATTTLTTSTRAFDDSDRFIPKKYIPTKFFSDIFAPKKMATFFCFSFFLAGSKEKKNSAQRSKK